jgi:hypothetical protein
LTSINAADVAHCLSIICYRYGFPKSLNCDQGKQYTSKLFRAFCAANGISISYAPPHTSNVGGFYERRHRDLNFSIRRLLMSKSSSLEEFQYCLAIATFRCNSIEIESSGITPYMLAFGFQPSLPPIFPINAGHDVGDDADIFKIASTAADRRTRIIRQYEGIYLDRREETRKQMKKQQLSEMRAESPILPGEKVLVKRKPKGKLGYHWQGPYTLISKNRFYVTLQSSDDVVLIAHLRNVKRFLDLGTPNVVPFNLDKTALDPSNDNPATIDEQSDAETYHEDDDVENVPDSFVEPEPIVDMPYLRPRITFPQRRNHEQHVMTTRSQRREAICAQRREAEQGGHC